MLQIRTPGGDRPAAVIALIVLQHPETHRTGPSPASRHGCAARARRGCAGRTGTDREAGDGSAVLGGGTAGERLGRTTHGAGRARRLRASAAAARWLSADGDA